MPALIAAAVILAYAAIALRAARLRYQVIRPWTEPVACRWPYHAESGHEPYCYNRWGDVDTTAEAVRSALQFGFAWPVFLVAVPVAEAAVLAVVRLVTGGARQLPEETAAISGRLEAENERLRRQQEGSPS